MEEQNLVMKPIGIIHPPIVIGGRRHIRVVDGRKPAR